MTTENEFLAFMKKIPDKEVITIDQWNKLMKESEKLDDQAGRLAEEHLTMIKPLKKKSKRVTNQCSAKRHKK